MPAMKGLRGSLRDWWFTIPALDLHPPFLKAMPFDGMTLNLTNLELKLYESTVTTFCEPFVIVNSQFELRRPAHLPTLTHSDHFT